MFSEVSNIKIAGISSSVPSKEVNNNKYEKVIGERQFKRQTRLTALTISDITRSPLLPISQFCKRDATV